MEKHNSKRLYDLAIKEKDFIAKLGYEVIEQIKSQGNLTCVYMSWDEINDLVRALEDRFGDLELNEVEDIDEKLVKLYERVQGHLMVMMHLRKENTLWLQNYSCLICKSKIENNSNLDDFWEGGGYCKDCWKKYYFEIMSGEL